MKRRRGGEGESQCTQKTISLQSPLGTIQVRGCEAGVHTIRLLMDVAPAERPKGSRVQSPMSTFYLEACLSNIPLAPYLLITDVSEFSAQHFG
ncbi:unnamed protein product [Boreogadus saida]